MADLQNRLTGNYYIAWLSRCDDAWRWLLSDRGPYTPMHVLKKQHHADCQRIAKEMLLTQLADKMQAKRLGLKNNPRRGTTMKRRRNSGLKTKFHRDGTVTVWDVYMQQRRRIPYSAVRDETLMSLPMSERLRIIKKQRRNPRRYRRNRGLSARIVKSLRRTRRKYKVARRKSRLWDLRSKKAMLRRIRAYPRMFGKYERRSVGLNSRRAVGAK